MPTPAADGRGRLLPVALTFVVFGMFWGGFAVAAADIENGLAVSHGQFGVLLSVGLAGAALANAAGGAAAERVGTERLLAIALAGWAILLTGGALVRHRAGFAVFVVGIVAIAGLVDVVMNVAGVAALGARPDRLVQLHALFNTGAAGGAALTGVLVASATSWRWLWGLGALGSIALAVVNARRHLPPTEETDRPPLLGAVSLLRRERLIPLAIAMATGAIVEGGIELWGVVFLRGHLPSGLLVGATGAAAGYAVAAIARLTLGPVIARRGPARGVFAGAGLAAVGIGLIATAFTPWIAGFGLVLAAGGIAMSWPLILASASADRARPAAVVGAVSAVGYLGFVAGPTLIGWVAAVAGLRTGLWLLAGAAVFVAIAPVTWRPATRP